MQTFLEVDQRERNKGWQVSRKLTQNKGQTCIPAFKMYKMWKTQIELEEGKACN